MSIKEKYQEIKKRMIKTKEENLLQQLFTLAKNPTKENESLFRKTYSIYQHFCEDNHIPLGNILDSRLLNSFYVLESTPVIKEVDVSLLTKAIEKTKKKEPVLEEEAKALIEWTVQNTRNILGQKDDIYTSSLLGACGLAQSASLFPLEDLGLKTTVNNIRFFPLCNGQHAFGTVVIPVLTENGVIEKQFLIDVTYRQFFSTILCMEDRYELKGAQSFAPEAGYFMIQTEKRKQIASQILKNGYIELNDEVAYEYANGFILSSIPKDNQQLFEEWKKITPQMCLDTINQKTEEHDYDREEFASLGYQVSFPEMQSEIRKS